ncbi:RraA family protein [Pseudonocardia asaccharolytica]|uniref:Putative 4-hydroxy-4-methyl-2-oxoglutarate aldolase n=1 Tax=Pseudonocardia asaccharolytica DSM 44247 = NBRC 16224 TaxID=1123024 RepID=A0A511CYA4_9PSEU|nr:RraA family protein [Pseudonocardia asaccharolytica]GEL17233.1 diguanylate cyclase [Pseudonocardia asaccharolytica DSM 44247 = NBRC 16224]
MSQLSEREILDRLRALDTSELSDALDRHGVAGQCHGLFPVDRAMHFAGQAFTVRYGPAGSPPGDVGDFIDDLGPGTVVVLDNQGRTDATVWGDLLTSVASVRGVAGTVIDGVCRDSSVCVDLGYPVFSRGRWMRTGKDRVQVEAYQAPVSIGGVRVVPSDYLIGDADGVVVVPAGEVTTVLASAEEIRDAEQQIRKLVGAGARLREAREQTGYHRLQSRAEG